jgi:hypothetical protein
MFAILPKAPLLFCSILDFADREVKARPNRANRAGAALRHALPP